MIKRFEIIGTPLNIPILFFIFSLFLSTIFSHYPIEGLDRTESMVRRIILYYLVIYGIKDLSIAKNLIFLLLIAAGIEAIYILSQYLWNFKLFGIVIHDEVSKLLSENRTLGGALGMLLPISISLWLFFYTGYKRILLGISNLIILLVFIFTQTRGAWIGVVLAFIIIGFIAIYKRRKILVFLFAFVIILPFLFPKDITNQFLPAFSDKTLGGRTYIWRDSLQIFKDYPLLGIGPGEFIKVYYPDYFSKEARGKGDFGHHHGHNNFLNVAVEGGIIGFGAFLWLMCASFFLSFRIIKKAWEDKELFPITLGLLGGLVVWLIHGLVDCTYLGNSMYLFWFVLGMIVSIGKTMPQQQKRK